jgi:hypothetical protein
VITIQHRLSIRGYSVETPNRIQANYFERNIRSALSEEAFRICEVPHENKVRFPEAAIFLTVRQAFCAR